MNTQLSLFTLLLLYFPFSFAASANQISEVQYIQAHLSENYGDWNDINIHHWLETGGKNHFSFETDFKNHFHETAILGGMSITHEYSDEWYQEGSLTLASNPKILPRNQIFTEIHRKFFNDRAFIAGIGIGHITNQDPYSDLFTLVEFAYYLNSKLVFQTGIRRNRSLPGPIDTTRFYGAIQTKIFTDFDFSYRYETGDEGYTIIGINSYSNKTSSSLHTFQLKYNFNTTHTISTQYEYYKNNAYSRNQFGIGYLIHY